MRSSASSVCITCSVMSKPFRYSTREPKLLPQPMASRSPSGRGRGELDACRFRELEDRLEAQRAVQVDVQVRLGQRLEDFERDRVWPSAAGAAASFVGCHIRAIPQRAGCRPQAVTPTAAERSRASSSARREQARLGMPGRASPRSGLRRRLRGRASSLSAPTICLAADVRRRADPGSPRRARIFDSFWMQREGRGDRRCSDRTPRGRVRAPIASRRTPARREILGLEELRRPSACSLPGLPAQTAPLAASIACSWLRERHVESDEVHAVAGCSSISFFKSRVQLATERALEVRELDDVDLAWLGSTARSHGGTGAWGLKLGQTRGATIATAPSVIQAQGASAFRGASAAGSLVANTAGDRREHGARCRRSMQSLQNSLIQNACSPMKQQRDGAARPGNRVENRTQGGPAATP